MARKGGEPCGTTRSGPKWGRSFLVPTASRVNACGMYPPPQRPATNASRTPRSPAQMRGQQLPLRRVRVRRPVRLHRRMRVIVHLVLRTAAGLAAPFVIPAPANDKCLFPLTTMWSRAALVPKPGEIGRALSGVGAEGLRREQARHQYLYGSDRICPTLRGRLGAKTH